MGGQPNNYLKVGKSISDLASLHRKYPFFNSEVSIFSIDGGKERKQVNGLYILMQVGVQP